MSSSATASLLKTSFLDLIARKEFETITVKDIALEAKVHRITFYDHFKDKYDLLDKIFRDMSFEAMSDSHRMNEENGISESSYSAISNYLFCFVQALKKRKQLVISLVHQNGGYIYFAFETFLNEKFRQLILFSGEKTPVYSLEQTTSLIVGAVISFVISGYRMGKYEGEDYNRLFYEAQELLQNLLSSKLFT